MRRRPQHALRREDDEWLAPRAQGLPAQQVEVLCGGGRLTYLHVVAGGEVEVALDACAGVFGALALVAVRQQQDQAGEQVPLGLARRDELVDDDLRAIGEVAELGFPHHQSLGIVARVAILEAEHRSFRQHGVVDLEAALRRADVGKRDVARLGLDIDDDGVALVESAALRILPAEAHRRTGADERGEGDKLGHAVVEGARAGGHLQALVEELLHLGMNVEARRNGGGETREFGDAVGRQAGVDLLVLGRAAGRRGSGSSTSGSVASLAL